MESKPNYPTAKRVLFVSFFVDILDVTLGIIVTLLTGSVVMLAEVLEGMADLVSSGLLVLGLSRSAKKADISHPFGYGRELYFWTLISALIMLSITATLTIYFGIQRFLNPQPVHNPIIANFVLLLTACTNGYALSLSLKRMLHGRSWHKIWPIFYHTSLIETKTAFVLDLMGTSASILGFVALLLYGITGNSLFDSAGAIMIGSALAMFASLLVVAVKDFLIGKGVSIQILEEIKSSVGRVESINSIQDLKATYVGPETIMVIIEVNAKDSLKTNELEKVIDKIKEEIQKDVPQAKLIQVELES